MWTEYISYSIERRPSKVLWISLYFIQQHHQLEALNRFIFRGISQQIACMITVQEYDFWKWATHERLKSQLLPHSLPFLYLCDVQIDVRPLRVHTFTCKSFNMQRLQFLIFMWMALPCLKRPPLVSYEGQLGTLSTDSRMICTVITITVYFLVLILMKYFCCP